MSYTKPLLQESLQKQPKSPNFPAVSVFPAPNAYEARKREMFDLKKCIFLLEEEEYVKLGGCPAYNSVQLQHDQQKQK